MSQESPNNRQNITRLSRGSMWHRWDPHIHSPGTVLNDQYDGPDPFDEFLRRIEACDPPIQALGVTDYCVLECYEKTIAARRAGRLPGVALIFPNVELRYSIETTRGSAINVHLLFSPEAADHVERIKRFFDALVFTFSGEKYRCRRDDLIRLGRAYDSSAVTDEAALRVGTNQFKVDLAQLRQEWKNSEWAQTNGLIAISGGEKDGTSGLRDPSGAFGALRKEVEKLAHIIFSANPRQADFWLGRGTATPEELESTWGGKKPCLHGSDAHAHTSIGAPNQERYCWLKGDLTFETLRQACIEPEGRVFIGPLPSRGALPSQTISELEVLNATWLRSDRVALNPGLVAVIGARGSGKTALADLIAAGAYALSPHLNARSFIKRARPFLADSSAALSWDSGERTSNSLDATGVEDLIDKPRVQYLSQQFVDQLCSAEGINDELLAEIERVIFQAHPIEDRMGADSFKSLLSLRTARARAALERNQALLEETAEQINAERARRAGKPALVKQQEELTASIKKDKIDRQSLIGKGQEERVIQLNTLTTAVDGTRQLVDGAKRRLQSLLALKDEVTDIRERRTSMWLTKLRQLREEANLSEAQWSLFRLTFTGNVDAILDQEITATTRQIQTLTGPAPGEVEPNLNEPPSLSPYVDAAGDLTDRTLSILEKEQTRLRRLVGIDTTNAKKLAALSDKIAKQDGALAKLGRDIERATKADSRIKELLDELRRAYEDVIGSRIDEETELRELYAPLASTLANQSESLRKLTFSVRRVVDLVKWAQRGEELLDLRVQGPFKGKGSLLEATRESLLQPWQTGTAADVTSAMVAFRERYGQGLLEHAPVSKTDRERYRDWVQSVSKWLYSTDHISVSYGIQYDGMEIEQLSPGTRGIVLLLLYLAIDGEDDRPLLIDQPEENLDPQSIFIELVHRFREARLRRQIIIITHNANLVVNTDADQVIVASCGAHRPGQLPEITYESGGLEDRAIRRRVCEILEGGEAAFRARAKRLRVVL